MSNVRSLVFLSNYFNHHQKPISDYLYCKLGVGYSFIETSHITSERKAMGWGYKDYPNYVVKAYETSSEVIKSLINTADVVVVGGAYDEYLIERKRQKKIIIRYSERPLKNGIEPLKFLPRFVRWHRWNPMRCPIYMLCASAYTAGDYNRLGLFRDKCYRWGYFPEVIKYDDIKQIIELKQKEYIPILFVSRLIGLKHPELPVLVAKRLKEDRIKYHLTMVGIGDMEDQIRDMIRENGLESEITHIRSLSPEEVKQHMESSAIFMFTSNRNEGWGAVLNESMNSGCAVIASSAIGSVPYLLEDGKNGYIYEDGNFDDLYKKVKDLCLNQDLRERFGIEAYDMIINMWNPENAANRLLQLIDDLVLRGYSDRYKSGPCSMAPRLIDGWYKDGQEDNRNNNVLQLD